MAVSWMSCEQGDAGKTAAEADSTLIQDSANTLVNQFCEYYYNNQTDSLDMVSASTLEYLRKHELWTQYYQLWQILAEQYVWWGQGDKGISEALKIQEDAISRNNDFGHAISYKVLGTAYTVQSDYPDAIECYRHVEELYPENERPSILFSAMREHAECLLELKEYTACDSLLKAWKTILAKYPLDEKSENADTYANWHRLYQLKRFAYLFEIEEYDQAALALDSAEYYLSIEGSYMLSLSTLATCQFRLAMAQGDYQAALDYSQRSMDLTKGLIPTHYSNALGLRSEAYERLGRYSEALADLREHIRLDDSLTAAQNKEQLNELNKRFEVNEIRMQAERDRMQAEQRQLLLLIIIAAVALLAALIYAVSYRKHAKRISIQNVKLAHLNSQLTIANARAEESSRMKTNFIQQISHEIRTPLNILSGFTQVITAPDMELDNSEKEEINKGIIDNTNRITELVNKMLDLSDANSRAVIERNDSVPAIQIATEAIQTTGIDSADNLAFRFEFTPEAETSILKTNRKAAVRILSLILDNAIKFKSDSRTDNKASLHVTASQHSIRFIVEDNGPGIPSEEAEHVFEEFVQLDNYKEGTGIGLTVARSLARRLGGDVTLDTAYTHGARFVVTLAVD